MSFFYHLLAPLLLAVYPVVFLYQVNDRVLRPSSLFLPLAVCAGVSVLVYGLWFAANGFRPLEASNAAMGFLLCFFLYGSARLQLLKVDILPVDHSRFLPTMLLVGVYLGLIIARLPTSIARRMNQAARFILGGLILYNLAGILVVEGRKGVSSAEGTPRLAPTFVEMAGARRPDIYFIIFDEFAGFDVIREYWHYSRIDAFEKYLTDKGFYVATHSLSRTASTTYEVAARLNYEYPEDGQDRVYYSRLIAHNKVMQQLSDLGYTTVVFDGTGGSFAFPGKIPIDADYAFEYVPGTGDQAGLTVDEFAKLVFDRTMLWAATDANNALYGPALARFRNNILYTIEKVPALADIPSPKFVYAHIMLPHVPFVFDENGNPNDAKDLYNWNYYLGSYIFATKEAQRLIDGILLASDPENPPVIILQSDHGARNMLTEDPNSVILSDYPANFKYHILNAILLPGSDYSQLTPDFAPINTFPLVLNLYFGEQIPFQ
jgi:hypothetical protein